MALPTLRRRLNKNRLKGCPSGSPFRMFGQAFVQVESSTEKLGGASHIFRHSVYGKPVVEALCVCITSLFESSMWGHTWTRNQGWSVRTHCVVLLAATMLVTGCAEDRNDPEQTHSPAPTRAELPSPAAEEEAEQYALDAYLGLMGAVVEASLEGAQDHPDLEVYARGQALELASDMLDGATATGEPVLRPEVTESDPEGEPPSMVIEDCMDSTAWVLEDHPEASPAEQSTRLYTATVTSVDGDWKVDDLWLGEPNAC